MSIERNESPFEKWCDSACNAMVKPVGFACMVGIAVIVIAAGIAVPVKLLTWAFGG